MRWVNHDEELRAKHMSDILKTIRLPLVHPYFLSETVAKDDLVKGCHKCR